MSFNYAAPKTWLTTVYIIEIEDDIAGDDIAFLEAGYAPSGNDNVPNLGLSKRYGYLSKFKGTLLEGTGDPSGSLGIFVDVDTATNTLYLNRSNMSFWRPTVTGGTTITAWTNITKSVQLNVKAVQFNDAGNENRYFEMRYDGSSVNLKDNTGNFADLTVHKLIFNEAEGMSIVQTRTSDDQLLLNYENESEAENKNGDFAVKRFSDVTGEGEDDQMFQWDEAQAKWVFRTRSGDLSFVQSGDLYIQGVKKTFAVFTVIDTQTKFDAIFNTDVDGGITEFTDAPTEPKYIFIKHGTYTLRNHIRIRRSSFIIRGGPGSMVLLDPSIMGSTGTFPSIFEIFPSGGDPLEQVELSVYLDGGGLSKGYLLRISRLKNTTIDLYVKDATFDFGIYYPLVADQFVGTSPNDDIFAPVAVYQKGNKFNVKVEMSYFTIMFHGLENSFIRGAMDQVYDDMIASAFEDCSKCVFVGLVEDTADIFSIGI